MRHGGVIPFLSPERSESLPQLGISGMRLAEDAAQCREGMELEFGSPLPIHTC